MGYSAIFKTHAAPTATGNQSYTGYGFQPKALIFFVQNLTADGYDSGSGKFGMGFSVSSSSRAAIGIPDAAVRHDNTKCITFIGGGASPSLLRAADLVSLDSDGFTLNWTTVNATAALFGVLALGGADLSNVYIKELTSPLSTGNQSYTGVGFKPDCILIMSAGLSTAPPYSNGSNGQFGFGFGTGSSNQMTNSLASLLTGNSAGRKQLTNKVLSVITPTTTLIESSIVSMDSDGFTLNWTTVDATADYCWVLCLKGGQYLAKSFNQPTSTGNQSITGIGFVPVCEIFTSFCAVSGTSIVTDAANCYGGSNSASSYFSIYKGGNSGSDGVDLDRTQAVKLETGNATQNVVSKATLSSHDTNGFTLNWGQADSTAREILSLCIGNSATYTQLERKIKGFERGLYGGF